MIKYNTSITTNQPLDSFIKEIVDYCEKNHDEHSPLERSIQICQQKTENGLCLEFGVWKGDTINFIADHLTNWTIFGFDSFEGLPEKWIAGYEKGTFSLDGNLPNVRKNVYLIKGLFDITLPQWLINNPNYTNIDLLHVDCDLYSSTKTVLSLVKHLISDKTIIVFDELINYPDYEKHEIKALYEFCQEMNYAVNILDSWGYDKQKVSISIIKL